MNNIKPVKFEEKHIEQAKALAIENYDEERKKVGTLPTVEMLEDFHVFVENGLGVVLESDNRMLGFMCCYNPIEGHFGKSKGVWSPAHAHGAVKQNRSEVYSRLYQTACQTWLKHGILSHAITLYAHDHETIKSFFNNGFGNRCIDAISDMNSIDTVAGDVSIEYYELNKNEFEKILPLKNKLIKHLNHTPMYIPYWQDTLEGFNRNMAKDHRYFVARQNDKIIAYMKIQDNGEHFACSNKSMINISGAYLLRQFRGRGIYTNLLSYTIKKLKQEGYQRIGVDYESFNPTAKGFWQKYFTSYTNSVVRRMDECILDMKGRCE